MDLDLDLADEFGAAPNGRHKCSMCYPTPTLGEGGGTGGGGGGGRAGRGRRARGERGGRGHGTIVSLIIDKTL